MTDLLLFAEDLGHAAFVEPLLRRVGQECEREVQIRTRTARGGRPFLISELRQFVKEYPRLHQATADVLVVVTDANCHGSSKWRKQVEDICEPLRRHTNVQLAVLIPDPHIEKWMLVDGHAFAEVFGKGCSAPPEQCERDFYKQMLITEMAKNGIDAQFGGMEWADAIVAALDYSRVDESLLAGIRELRRVLSTD